MAWIIFVLTFSLIVNKHLIKSFFEGFVKQKARSEDLKDEKILNFIKNKTGLNLQKIKLLDTRTTWGMMAGLPGAPYMIISKDAYENFSKDELQWLLLHEAGHYILWHNFKIIFLQLLFIVLGILILMQFNYLLLGLCLAIVLVIPYTQLARKFEYEANDYALARMDNPEGLKNLYQKAKERWRKKVKKEDSILQRLFSVWILEIYKDLNKKATS